MIVLMILIAVSFISVISIGFVLQNSDQSEKRSMGNSVNIVFPELCFSPVKALKHPALGRNLFCVYKTLTPDRYRHTSFLNRECANGRSSI